MVNGRQNIFKFKKETWAQGISSLVPPKHACFCVIS